VASYCMHGNELVNSLDCWEILEKLSNGWLLKKGLNHGIGRSVGRSVDWLVSQSVRR
jgi:hypothetical protein